MTDEEIADKYAEEYFGKITELVELWKVKAYKEAFLDGLKAGRPEWHKVADGDLPKHEVNVLVLFNKQCIDIAHYNYDYKEWHFADSIVRDVIAWCEIPAFTDKE